MANRTLSDLPVVTTIGGADILHTRQSTTDKSVSEAKIAEYVQNLSDYAPTVVAVTGTTHTVSTTIRKQLIICTIASNCTFTFPGAFGNAKEIIVRNEVGSAANVLGLPNSEVLYPGSEITFIWNGSGWIKRNFSTNLLTGTASPAITPSFIGQTFVDGTNNRIWIATGTGSSADWTEINPSNVNIVTTAVSVTIADTVKSQTIYVCNPNTASQYGLLTITLPTLADNIGKEFTIQFGTAGNANGGLIKVIAEGAETINYKGNALNFIWLYQKGDHITLYDDGACWEIKKIQSIFNTGFYGCSDQTSMSFPSPVFLYDTKSASIDFTGMTITESTSGNTWVILRDSGGTGSSGTFYCYQATGTGIATNDRTLTTSSGATALVNETGGSNKNKVDKIYHYFGVNPYFFNIKTYCNRGTSQTEATTNLMSSFIDTEGTNYGQNYINYDANSLYFNSTSSGSYISDNSFGAESIAASDYLFKHVINF